MPRHSCLTAFFVAHTASTVPLNTQMRIRIRTWKYKKGSNPLKGFLERVKTMGKQLTAKDLNLDDGYEEEEEITTGKGPGEDSSEAKFKGSPEHGEIGAEAVEKEVEEKKARQKKAEEDRAAEELAKVEGEDKGKTDEETQLEYKDQAAAEKAVKEAKKKMTEATTKAKKLETVVSDLQKRVDEAASKAPVTAAAENPWDVKRQKIADDTIAKAAAIPSPVPPQDREDPEFDTKWADYQKKMGEYNGKVALVWADAQTEIANLAFEEREEAKRNKEAVISAVDTALEEAGLISDKTSPKEKERILRLFWDFSTDVSKSLPMEDQIKETAKLCKDFVDELRGEERERARKEKENQENLEVIGRGAKVTTKKEPEASHTMGDAQRAALERRKLRHSP